MPSLPKLMVVNAALIAVLAVMTHFYLGPGFTLDDVDNSMVNKTLVIISPDVGMGPHVVGLFLRAGANIVLVCDSMERCYVISEMYPEEWKNDRMMMYAWNASSFMSARSTAENIMKINCTRCPKPGVMDVHYLILNQVVALAPKKVDGRGWERHLAHNLLGPFMVSYHMRKMLRQNQTRIVTITSLLSHLTFPVNPINTEDLMFSEGRWYNPFIAYAQSQRAVLWFTHELNRRLQDRGASAVACRLGQGKIVPPSSGVQHWLFDYVADFYNAVLPTDEQAALPVVYAALKAGPADLVGPRLLWWGPPTVLGTALKPFPYPSDDAEAARKFWEQTINITKVTEPIISSPYERD